jgi:hypothetical protein
MEVSMLGKWLAMIVPVVIAASAPSAAADRFFDPGSTSPPVQLALSDMPAAKVPLGAPVLSSSGAQGNATLTAATSRSSGAATGAEGRLGGGFPPAGTAVPEPSGWAMLLCALAILGFIAVRKSGRD